ncbi:MAG: GNAT family N-acetyltransferase [Dehalococcoidia bacterium]|nr:GNAT family N-acetyltransferase [Dehalococcoidia bacterium]MCA9824619.1 GNAT family N-acetyltransferase [Dehalococcoidia bacterium]MCA9845174.1 GNAT family N-acetyltransferase [Dehalococcoidia bacterium]
MTRTTEFRQATMEDCDAIADIVRSLGAQNVGLAADFDSEAAKTWIHRLGSDGIIELAFDGSIPIAFGAIDFDTTEPETATLGVWVAPAYRRRGLATDLAERLIAFARDKGYRRIRGRLPDNNEPALSFLSAIGAMVPLRNPDMTFELPL